MTGSTTQVAVTTGRVKWFNDVRGFGFIRLGKEDGSLDVFVHYSAIVEGGVRKTLTEGESVSLEVVKGEKGLSAANVQRLYA
jgi:CspA family cold shock protein